MITSHEADLREAWDQAWRVFDHVLSDLGLDSPGDPWDPWALAHFLDVPSFAIAELVPAVAGIGFAEEFDLIDRVRKSVSSGVARLAGEWNEPLPLQWGLTGAILAWEWARLEAEGDRPSNFFERLRELRLRIPEVSLCERTVHQFCERVPAPSFD